MSSAAVVHILYVALGPTGSAEANNTRTIAQYLVDNKPTLTQMGIEVKVEKISSAMQKDRRVIDGFLRKGITRLPALVTGRDVYIGCADIMQLYEGNIRAFIEPPPAPAPRPAPRRFDTYDDFQRSEIGTAEDAREEAASEGAENPMGDGGDLSAQYRAAMDRRSEMTARRTPGGARAPGPAPEPEPAEPRVEPRAEPRVAPRVAPRAPPRQDNLEGDDDEITSMLSRLSATGSTGESRGRLQETRTKVQASLGDDGDYDPQDDVLLNERLGL